MNPEAAGGSEAATAGNFPGTWSRRRWVTLGLVVFAVQMSFILVLGDRQPISPRSVPPVKAWRLDTPLAELNNPMLFALPSPHGVAGLTWMRAPAVTNTSFRWTPPPRLLSLPEENFNLALVRLETNAPATVKFEAKPGPVSFLASITAGSYAPAATNSLLQLTGDLADRQWLDPPSVRSWPGTNLLSTTIVQALVNEAGDVLSVTLLPPGSGSREADLYALQLVRQARFAPGQPGATPVLGQLIFRWNTTPPGATQ